MRGREQHVERKIRLWVAQQERKRLSNGQSQRVDAVSGGRGEQSPGDGGSRASERQRLR